MISKQQAREILDAEFPSWGTYQLSPISGGLTNQNLLIETDEGDARSKNAVYICVPADAEGFEIIGDWDPVGMRATVSRGLKMTEAFVPDDLALLPPGTWTYPDLVERLSLFDYHFSFEVDGRYVAQC